MKIAQTNDELMRHLHDSIRFLMTSCAAFDSGFLGESKRLATTVRVLLHDTPNSKSLLGLLNLKSNLKYITTATRYDPQNLLTYHGLVGFRFGPQGVTYWAPLGDGPPTRYNRPPCNFDAWWNEAVIIDKIGGKFTRRDLILALANKEGGAHVDPELDASYADITRNNSLGWNISDGTTSQPLSDVELHSVRQIAYELLQSLLKCGITTA